jgi:hypothetical protein
MVVTFIQINAILAVASSRAKIKINVIFPLSKKGRSTVLEDPSKMDFFYV